MWRWEVSVKCMRGLTSLSPFWGAEVSFGQVLYQKPLKNPPSLSLKKCSILMLGRISSAEQSRSKRSGCGSPEQTHPIGHQWRGLHPTSRCREKLHRWWRFGAFDHLELVWVPVPAVMADLWILHRFWWNPVDVDVVWCFCWGVGASRFLLRCPTGQRLQPCCASVETSVAYDGMVCGKAEVSGLGKIKG